MANINIKEWQIGDNTYKFKDEEARQQLATKQDTITRVTASVDSNVGTPSVTPSWNNGTLDFAFSNIKGVQGIQGEKGTQGDSLQPINNVGELVLAHTTGQDNTKAISQKGATDYFASISNIVSEGDLKISDINGNVILELRGGHIIVKNFNSEHILRSDEYENADWGVADENGNIILSTLYGHILTKNFSSAKVLQDISKHDDIIERLSETQNPFGFNAEKIYNDAIRRMEPSNAIPLIIVAGQSNAEGRAPYNTAPGWLLDNDYSLNDFYMWDGNAFSEYNVRSNNGASVSSGSDGTGVDKFGFDIFFAKKYIEKYGEVYAIKQAIGGVGMCDYTNRSGTNYTWCPQIGKIEEDYHVNVIYCLLSLIDKVKAAKVWADSNNKILVPTVVLWHQGEHEANSNFIQYYKQNLEYVVSFIRGILATPKIPFISGYIMKSYNSLSSSVNQIMQEVADVDSHMECVDMEGHYSSIGDNLHYDVTALEYMGNEMFNKFEDIH